MDLIDIDEIAAVDDVLDSPAELPLASSLGLFVSMPLYPFVPPCLP